MKQKDDGSSNFLLAAILSALILFTWNYFFDNGFTNKSDTNITNSNNISEKDTMDISHNNHFESVATDNQNEYDRNDKRYKIELENDSIRGSISLVGARINDIILKKYKDSVESEDNVRLLSPAKMNNAYFAEFGWISNKTETPNSETIWKADSKTLSPNNDVTFSWVNNEGVLFQIIFSIDDRYMFNIEQKVVNNTDKKINVSAYNLINKTWHVDSNNNDTISHQGAAAVINQGLEEYSYSKLKDNRIKKFKQNIVDWIGITDKYWLVSIIPSKSEQVTSSFQYAEKQQLDKIQVDSIYPANSLNPRSEYNVSNRLFVGPKQTDILDDYAQKYNIKLFDRAIDFGWLYIITKPLFYILKFCYNILGNFGLSIMFVTVIIKILMFGLSNKSYKSIAKLRSLQPKIDQLKSFYGNDKIQFNQKLLELYKKEKVNPFSGILSLFIQIPVFFAVYKVLYVTIEMRHAPFYGWIQDLSSPDPTNIFNLFGLLPINLPSFLHIGAWPILMSLSMYLQQKMSPQPSDPTQAQIMRLLPIILLFMFANFPAGLLIYWTWSNLLSILQQKFLSFNATEKHLKA